MPEGLLWLLLTGEASGDGQGGAGRGVWVGKGGEGPRCTLLLPMNTVALSAQRCPTPPLSGHPRRLATPACPCRPPDPHLQPTGSTLPHLSACRCPPLTRPRLSPRCFGRAARCRTTCTRWGTSACRPPPSCGGPGVCLPPPSGAATIAACAPCCVLPTRPTPCAFAPGRMRHARHPRLPCPGLLPLCSSGLTGLGFRVWGSYVIENKEYQFLINYVLPCFSAGAQEPAPRHPPNDPALLGGAGVAGKPGSGVGGWGWRWGPSACGGGRPLRARHTACPSGGLPEHAAPVGVLHLAAVPVAWSP